MAKQKDKLLKEKKKLQADLAKIDSNFLLVLSPRLEFAIDGEGRATIKIGDRTEHIDEEAIGRLQTWLGVMFEGDVDSGDAEITPAKPEEKAIIRPTL